ncbi:hypothetical protein NECAME_12074 [Necator americanus]|uniref:Uncharacterized protein n=1 Tax=Necator americanus TaxID=51031 RepID=W2T1M7_NECAM|nr:hypothetical protein NECAME_12074 [Necator americanus]ETN75900.1 hypothetical protein NECAME_12074 [Necator americanus]
MVEFIGCTDDCGNTIVWSDQIEFVVDHFNLFKNQAFGLYLITVIRHFRASEFPRWKVTGIKKAVQLFRNVCVKSKSNNNILALFGLFKEDVWIAYTFTSFS